MANHDGITTYGVFEALSVGSKPYKGKDEIPQDKPRSITCMMQPGDEDDDYGGWKQVDSLHGVETLTLPDGTHPDHGDTPTFGYDDDKFWAIIVEDEDAGHYRIEEYTGGR